MPLTAVPSSCVLPWGQEVMGLAPWSPRGYPQKEDLALLLGGLEKDTDQGVKTLSPFTHLQVSRSPLGRCQCSNGMGQCPDRCCRGATLRMKTRKKAECVAGLLSPHLPPVPPPPAPQAFFLSVLCFVFITLQEPWGV